MNCWVQEGKCARRCQRCLPVGVYAPVDPLAAPLSMQDDEDDYAHHTPIKLNEAVSGAHPHGATSWRGWLSAVLLLCADNSVEVP